MRDLLMGLVAGAAIGAIGWALVSAGEPEVDYSYAEHSVYTGGRLACTGPVVDNAARTITC